MDKYFVETLLREACNPLLFHTVGECKWDAKTKMLIMPEDKDEFLPAGPHRHEALSLPISVMAFMMSSDVMKAAREY